MQRVTLPPAGFVVDGHPERSETLLAYAGVFQLTLSTELPDLGAQLHSTYLGHPEVEHTSASHLWIAAGGAHLWTIEHEAATFPVMQGRRRCLLDHLSTLADQLRVLRLEVAIDVPGEALDQVDEA